MNVAVIGAEGFIGSHCVDQLSAEGHQLAGFDRVTMAGKDYRDIFEGKEFDCFINAAGSAVVSRSFDCPADDFRDNVNLVSDLLGAIKDTTPHSTFINLSSAAVYGNPVNLPIAETAQIQPLSPYGHHKVMSEQLIREYHDLFEVRGVSLRIFSAYGERLKKQLFWDLHNKAQASDAVELLGTGQETRDFIYIDDIVRAIGIIMTKADFAGEVYNVANGTEITIQEAAETFLEEFGWSGQLSFSQKEHVGYPANWRADISKIKELGYIQESSFVEGIRNYCQWLKQE